MTSETNNTLVGRTDPMAHAECEHGTDLTLMACPECRSGTERTLPADEHNGWTATELRRECESFVDRMVPLSIGSSTFERVVDGVFDAMKFLLGKP